MRNRIKIILIILGIATICTSVNAEVIVAKSNYFEVLIEQTINTSVEKLNKEILEIGDWWSPAHSYSLNGSNLYLDVISQRCFCEKLADGGYVIHMKLVNYQPAQLLRLSGGLGPLQSLPVNGVLDFNLKQLPEARSQLKVTYKVSGNGTA